MKNKIQYLIIINTKDGKGCHSFMKLLSRNNKNSSVKKLKTRKALNIDGSILYKYCYIVSAKNPLNISKMWFDEINTISVNDLIMELL